MTCLSAEDQDWEKAQISKVTFEAICKYGAHAYPGQKTGQCENNSGSSRVVHMANFVY
jgi:hypothetical protein